MLLERCLKYGRTSRRCGPARRRSATPSATFCPASGAQVEAVQKPQERLDPGQTAPGRRPRDLGSRVIFQGVEGKPISRPRGVGAARISHGRRPIASSRWTGPGVRRGRRPSRSAPSASRLASSPSSRRRGAAGSPAGSALAVVDAHRYFQMFLVTRISTRATALAAAHQGGRAEVRAHGMRSSMRVAHRRCWECCSWLRRREERRAVQSG